jgi:hypothetical protein
MDSRVGINPVVQLLSCSRLILTPGQAEHEAEEEGQTRPPAPPIHAVERRPRPPLATSPPKHTRESCTQGQLSSMVCISAVLRGYVYRPLTSTAVAGLLYTLHTGNRTHTKIFSPLSLLRWLFHLGEKRVGVGGREGESSVLLYTRPCISLGPLPGRGGGGVFYIGEIREA